MYHDRQAMLGQIYSAVLAVLGAKVSTSLVFISSDRMQCPSRDVVDHCALAVQLNSFNIQHASGRSIYTTLHNMAHFNHSCAPNCTMYLDPNAPFPTRGTAGLHSQHSAHVLQRMTLSPCGCAASCLWPRATS